MDGTLDFDSSHLGGRPNNLKSYNSSIYLVKSPREGYFKVNIMLSMVQHDNCHDLGQ